MKESYNEGRKIEIVAYYRKCKSITKTCEKFKVHRNTLRRWNNELPAMLPDRKWAVKRDVLTGQEEYVLNTTKDIEDKAMALSMDMNKIIEVSVQLMLDRLDELKRKRIETNKLITPTEYNLVMKIMNTVLPYTIPSATSNSRLKQPEDGVPKTSAFESFKQMLDDLDKKTKKSTAKPN